MQVCVPSTKIKRYGPPGAQLTCQAEIFLRAGLWFQKVKKSKLCTFCHLQIVCKRGVPKTTKFLLFGAMTVKICQYPVLDSLADISHITSVSVSVMGSPHCTLKAVRCTLYTKHCTLHTAHFTLQTAHCTLHTAHCILHTAHFTLHTAHCTLYDPDPRMCQVSLTSFPHRREGP